ncbi:MAG: hypothetical protein LUF04_06585 [Bacteroides sp.]|nr:hypothetical protein [Bacteroides sp.]
MNQNLHNLYQPYENPQPDHEQEILELTWRVQELERKLEEAGEQKELIEQQYEMMERSYELAAKYMPNNYAAGGVSSVVKENTVNTNSGQNAKTVRPTNQSVVSLLTPTTDYADLTQPRNISFHTVGSSPAHQNRLKKYDTGVCSSDYDY